MSKTVKESPAASAAEPKVEALPAPPAPRDKPKEGESAPADADDWALRCKKASAEKSCAPELTDAIAARFPGKADQNMARGAANLIVCSSLADADAMQAAAAALA